MNWQAPAACPGPARVQSKLALFCQRQRERKPAWAIRPCRRYPVPVLALTLALSCAWLGKPGIPFVQAVNPLLMNKQSIVIALSSASAFSSRQVSYPPAGAVTRISSKPALRCAFGASSVRQPK